MSQATAPPSPVLVTGANGFIGTALCGSLVRAGCQVRGLILDGTPPGALPDLGVEVVAGDICQPGTLGPALAGVKTVFHLAALASDWAPWARFMAINADGTQNALEAARDAGVDRFVHMSSLAVHRFTGHVQADEATVVGNDVNGYCTSKIVAESMVRRASSLGWFDTTIIRPGAVILGPGDTTAFIHLAPALESGGMPLVDDGARVTCFSYVDNLTTGMLQAAAAPEGAGHIFILTDDAMITWRSYMTAVCQALGVEPRFRSIPGWLAGAAGWTMEAAYRGLGRKEAPVAHRYRVGLVARDFHFSCAKAKRVLGYRPSVALEEGLQRTVDWYRGWCRERQ